MIVYLLWSHPVTHISAITHEFRSTSYFLKIEKVSCHCDVSDILYPSLRWCPFGARFDFVAITFLLAVRFSLFLAYTTPTHCLETTPAKFQSATSAIPSPTAEFVEVCPIFSGSATRHKFGSICLYRPIFRRKKVNYFIFNVVILLFTTSIP